MHSCLFPKTNDSTELLFKIYNKVTITQELFSFLSIHDIIHTADANETLKHLHFSLFIDPCNSYELQGFFYKKPSKALYFRGLKFPSKNYLLEN